MELLSVWRIMKYDDVDNPDTLKALAEEFQTENLIPPVSIENEKKVIAHFEGGLKSFLKKYPSTLDMDYELWKSKDLTRNQRAALAITMEEKITLEALLQWCDTIGTLLDSPREDMSAMARKLVKSKKFKGKAYLKSLLRMINGHEVDQEENDADYTDAELLQQ